MESQEKAALKRVVELVDGQSELARRLTKLVDDPEKRVTQAHVWNWLYRDKKVPAEYVVFMEQLVDAQVKRYELRPDVFPPPSDAA